jgi:hypothetical protein
MAEELATQATPAEERQQAKEHRKKIKKEHKRHERLIARAEALLQQEDKTGWHVDEEPTIPGLPEGATVAYRLKDRDTALGVNASLQARVKVPGSDKKAKATIATMGSDFERSDHCLGPDTLRIPFRYTYGDESREYDDGIVMGKVDFDNQPLTPVHSSTEGFKLVKHAISVIEAGEPEPPVPALDHVLDETL